MKTNTSEVSPPSKRLVQALQIVLQRSYNWSLYYFEFGTLLGYYAVINKLTYFLTQRFISLNSL